MHIKPRFIFIAAILAAVSVSANHAIAQGAATAPAAAGNMSYQDICVTDPNAKLTPSVKPRKKFANVARTAPVQARAKRLASVRKKRPPVEQAAVDICPPGQKPMRVTYAAPPQPSMSLCQMALGASANVTASQASGMLIQAGLNDNSYTQNGMLNVAMVEDTETLAAATSAAIKANPDAAPAILAFVIRGLNPNDTVALQAVTRAAYLAAPSQAAGLTYAAVSTNPGQTMPITQAMLGAAGPADDAIIRQCAIDANPDLANQIATAAFVPALAGPTSIGQNDIRNTINNATGSTTLIPDMIVRELDDSP